jgi:DNA-directed RNA polymerase subunit beta
MAGRHGNTGVVSKIVPRNGMRFLPNGRRSILCEIPRRIQSNEWVKFWKRISVGLVKMAIQIATDIFNGIPESQIREYLNLQENGKSVLSDGGTGERFGEEVVVGSIHVMKLNHLMDYFAKK